MADQREMFHIAYVSRREARLTEEQIVEGIVLPSMRKNRKLELSGCIWFDSNFFLQVLEGAKPDLMGLYERIKEDRRHHSIRVFSAQAIEQRDFQRFSMRLIGREAPTAVHDIISRYEAELEFQPLQNDQVIECDVVVRRLITEISTQIA